MKKMQKILCPTDFSEFANEGLLNATLLARSFGAKLLIVHVQKPSDHDSPQEQENVAQLKMVQPTDSEVAREHWLLTGDAAEQISHFALLQGVDLIVMGTHGRSGVSQLLMGSVAKAVVQTAPCPVHAYKPFHEEPETTLELEIQPKQVG